MSGEPPITVVGNLVADPELRFTPSGAAVTNFRIASTPRTYNRQTNEWEDGEALFLSCSVWRQYAENVAESLTRGMGVIVTGKLKSRSYEDRDGVKRTLFEVDVDEVGPSLRNATAKISKVIRDQAVTQSTSARSQGYGEQQNDPWHSPAQNQNAPQGGWGQSSDGATEPPF